MSVPPPTTKHIFICYSRRDKVIVDWVVSQIEARGLALWMDRSGIVGADRWRAVIVEALQNSGAVLFFGSRHSFDSEHVAAELTLAKGEWTPIIPILLDDARPSGDIAYLIAGLHRIRLTGPEDSSAIDQIAHAAATKVGQAGHVGQVRPLSQPVPSGKNPARGSRVGIIAVFLLFVTAAAAVSWHFARQAPVPTTAPGEPPVSEAVVVDVPLPQTEMPLPARTEPQNPIVMPPPIVPAPPPVADEPIEEPEPTPAPPAQESPPKTPPSPVKRPHSPGTVSPEMNDFEIED